VLDARLFVAERWLKNEDIGGWPDRLVDCFSRIMIGVVKAASGSALKNLYQ